MLDTSGSMYGRKIEQLIQAMKSILNELKENDLFNIVDFDTNVRAWDLNTNSSVNYSGRDEYWNWQTTEPTKNIEVSMNHRYIVNLSLGGDMKIDSPHQAC